MLQNRVTVQLFAFLLLSGGVAANILLLQTSAQSVAGSSSQSTPTASWNIAAITGGEFGDTGSIGADGSIKSSMFDLAALARDSADDRASPAEMTRAIQRELQIRGYETGTSDGVAGLMTRAAIMAFEHDNGLPITARPNQPLLKSILLGVSDKNSGRGVQPTHEAQEVTRSVQRSLAALGYDPGPTTGMLTAETSRAIRAFETDQAMPESGRVSGPLVSRLARLVGGGPLASAP